MRIIAIGDIHGCADELQDLLDVIKPNPNDQLVFLGDLINRGPNSRGVLDIVQSLDNATCVMGNHELRLLKFHNTKDDSKLKPYDPDTLDILEAKDWEFFRSMAPTCYFDKYETVFVHGGFVPNTPWDKQPIDVVCRVQVIDENGRGTKRSKSPDSPLWSTFWHGPPYVVYGHIPKKKIQRTTWTLGIDTACVYGGSLTAYILPSKDIIQVPARKTYIHKSSL